MDITTLQDYARNMPALYHEQLLSTRLGTHLLDHKQVSYVYKFFFILLVLINFTVQYGTIFQMKNTYKN